jgi:hypothetical protein
VFAFFAALLAASPAPAPATPEQATTNTPAPAAQAGQSTDSDVLEAALPWWERITVTVDDKGTQQGCRYETSQNGSLACDKEMADSVKARGVGTTGLFKKVTFERRFSPGGKLDSGKLQPGDTLLGRQIMFLTIDASGAIASCKIVATSGDVPSSYDCEDARKEQFRAQASTDSTARQAFMTVLAYGHIEAIA